MSSLRKSKTALVGRTVALFRKDDVKTASSRNEDTVFWFLYNEQNSNSDINLLYRQQHHGDTHCDAEHAVIHAFFSCIEEPALFSKLPWRDRKCKHPKDSTRDCK
jgi:hypothetical protein